MPGRTRCIRRLATNLLIFMHYSFLPICQQCWSYEVEYLLGNIRVQVGSLALICAFFFIYICLFKVFHNCQLFFNFTANKIINKRYWNNIAGKKISDATSEANVNRYYFSSGYTFPAADKKGNFPPFHNGKHHSQF